jgi:uncharacterized membrane protein YozB (DUF420 family)
MPHGPAGELRKSDAKTAVRVYSMVPLAFVVLVFVGFSVPPYLSLDASRSRIPPPDGVPSYFPLLVAHVVFGSVAMLTCCIQIWPWLRSAYPATHRRIGRLYVYGGVLPAGVIGLAIGAISPFGPTLRVSNVLLASLWLAVTLTGERMGRRGRVREHRRWMIRSFALTLSVITNRVWAVLGFVFLSPQLATTFGGSESAMIQTIAGLSGWLGWVVTLVAAEWWLESSDKGLTARPATALEKASTS